MMTRCVVATLVAVFGACCGLARADYPSKPVTIVVPFAAGGPTDSAGRIIARAFERQSGQAFVVENVGGAGSTLGATRVATAPPDGHTLLLATSSALVMAPHLYSNLRYDPFKSFQPIGQITESPFFVLVNSASPFKTFDDLLAHAKANPGKLNFGTPGLGTVHHLTFELMMDAAQFSAVHVPFKGAAPTVTALLGGEIDLIVETPNSVDAMIAAGRLRPLAVTSAKRAPAKPDIPTLQELGLADLETRSWFALLAPKGVPGTVLLKLQTMLDTALNDEETQKALRAAGFEPTPQGSASLSRMIEVEFARFGKIIKARNIKLGQAFDESRPTRLAGLVR